MMPSARKQAERIGSRLGRCFALMHIASGSHVGELNRIRKKLTPEHVASLLADIAPREWSFSRWQSAIVRGFRRSAIGLLTSPIRNAPR